MDELYRVARRVLLDALEALGPHRDAVVLVGAQAIYLQTGEADFAVAAYTTDADLALDPAVLRERPPLEHMLTEAGFQRGASSGVGVWKTTQRLVSGVDAEVQVDLLVPSAVGPGTGRRAASQALRVWALSLFVICPPLRFVGPHAVVRRSAA